MFNNSNSNNNKQNNIKYQTSIHMNPLAAAASSSSLPATFCRPRMNKYQKTTNQNLTNICSRRHCQRVEKIDYFVIFVVVAIVAVVALLQDEQQLLFIANKICCGCLHRKRLIVATKQKLQVGICVKCLSSFFFAFAFVFYFSSLSFVRLNSFVVDDDDDDNDDVEQFCLRLLTHINNYVCLM